MKFRAIACILLLISLSPAAWAESDWVTRFLERYSSRARKSAGVTPAISGPPVSLAAMVQNGAVALTTEDVIRLLLENNRDLTVSRGVPLSSFYAIESLFRPFEPNFHVIGDISHTTTPSSNVLEGAASLIQLIHNYRVGIDQALQTGTAYSVDFEFIRSSSNSVFTVYNPAYDGLITYRVTQHVLRDFGRRANSRLIRIARNDEKISELDFELEIIDLITEALLSYWDLVFGVEDIKVKQRSLDLAAKTLRDNRIQVQVGTLASIDLIQAEAEMATRQEDLVTAQYDIDQLQDQLKKMISSDTDPGLVLASLNLIEPVTEPGSRTLMPLSQAIQFALENRPEMRQASYDIENQEINVEWAKNQMLPVLDVTAGYSHSGLGGTQTIRSGFGQGSEILRVVPGGVGDMFRQLYGFNFPGYSAGFTLRIPMGNRAAKADYERAINERGVSTMRKAAIAQQIALEVRNAYTQVDMNRARVATARTARQLNARRLDAEQKKFDLGASTVRFVLEEQRNLAQAETNEIEALANYSKALVSYDRAIGNTLARNNIELDKQLPRQLTSRN
jgi:outer membrane protein TolC